MVEVYQRVERKYLINQQLKDQLLNQINQHLILDPYCVNGPYFIYNIYFDNDANQMIRRSIQRPLFKEKLRIRTYDISSTTHLHYLEIKRKVGRLVSKRRISAALLDISELIHTGFLPPTLSQNEIQIAKEIRYLVECYQGYPKVFLSYQRQAFFGSKDATLRITFDNQLRYRFEQIEFNHGNHGSTILNDDQYIMEIKFNNVMPIWLVKVLSELKIYPTSYSKYGQIYQKHQKGV